MKKYYFLDLQHRKAKMDPRNNFKVLEPAQLILYLQTSDVLRKVEKIDIINHVRREKNWDKITEKRFQELINEFSSYPYFELNNGFLRHLKNGHTVQTSFLDGNSGDLMPISKKKFRRLVYEDAILDNDHIPLEPAKLFILFEDGQRINIINYVRELNNMLRVSQKLKTEIKDRIVFLGGEMEVTNEGFIKDLKKFIKIR